MDTGVAALFFVSLLAAMSDAASQCQNDYTFTFKPSVGPGGLPSFITPSSTQVPVYPFVNMPPVILLFTLVQNADVDLTLDGTLVTATASPLLRLGGAAVQLTQGQAIFRALQIQQQPDASATSTTIVFSITVPYGNSTTTYTLTSPPLRVLSDAEKASPPVSLVFGNYGLFFRASQVMDISNDTVLPGFTLQLQDILGNVASTRRASIAISLISGSTNVFVTPSVLNITGSADVNNLVIHNPGPATFIIGKLQFVATMLDTVNMTTSTLLTGDLTMNTTDKRFMMFDPARSFFSENNIGNTAVLGTSLPSVVIQVVNLQWEVDTGFQDVVVVAKAPGAVLQGDAALVINGYATFSDLKFITLAPQAAVITFTAALAAGTIRTLFSGAVSVSKAPIKARHLSFDAKSSVQQANAAALGVLYTRLKSASSPGTVTIPLLCVLLLDSGYQPDYSANGITLNFLLISTDTAYSPPTLLLPTTQGRATVSQGFAKVQDLLLEVTTDHQTHPFVIRVQDASGIRPPLDSAPMLIVPSVTLTAGGLQSRLVQCRSTDVTNCSLSLSFAAAPYSHVSAADGPVTATVGALIPEIRVLVNDLAGPLDPLATFPLTTATLYAFTSSSPSAEEFLSTDSNLAGVWMGSYFSFSCLKLATAPSRLIRLYFAFFYSDPTTRAQVQVVGIATIRTAFITIATDTTGNFDIEFVDDSNSFLTYAGQPSQAVVGVFLPTIQVQVIDSLGNVDASSTSTSTAPLLLGVSSSSGGATIDVLVPFVNGIATISTLRFSSAAFNPVITFTVQATTAYSLLSRTSLASGPVALSAGPINAVGIAVKPFTTCSSLGGRACVNASLQAMTLATLNDVLLNITVGVTDSTNEYTKPTTSPFEIRISCDQANFDATLATTVSGTVGSLLTVLTPGLTGLKSEFAAKPVPIYMTLLVTSAPDYPALLGASVVIGPITVTALSSASSATCAGAASAPVVVLKLYSDLATVTAGAFLQSQFLTNLCYLMGVETSRLSIVDAPSITSGVTTDTTRWEGTRLSIQFSDPSPTSSNRDSAATLAAALVALRPDCQAPSLSIASIYYAADEQGCEVNAFTAAVATATECASRGFYSTCQCFQDNVVSPMGVVCSVDVVVKDAFATMCQRLSNCAQSEIISVCENALQDNSNKYVWAFGAFGGVIGLAVLVYMAVKLVFLRQAPVRLHKE